MDIEVAEIEVDELDLLRRLSGSENDSYLSASSSGEMDLCLGLSLGGSFSVENGEKRLVRSSSIAEISVFQKEKEFSLARTCSMPVEADEENRKRKEMQSLKRLEAKRKREEKRSFSRPGFDGELCLAFPPRAGLRRNSLNIESRGSRVPEIALLNNNNNDNNNSRSPSTSDSIKKPGALRSLKSFGEDDEAMKRMTNQSSKDTKNSIMEEMPCVSTKGDGPNGKRIEGFLYRYKKGEDVSIVCVCHGTVHTPSQFIKHAGGGDVDNPLRHIVVNPPCN